MKPNKDALALIIGVADYERTPAKAAYADKDAKTFYDYAMLKLGIPAGNIKELVNVDANRIDVHWLSKTGLHERPSKVLLTSTFLRWSWSSQSVGEQMYLLPYDGSPGCLKTQLSHVNVCSLT